MLAGCLFWVRLCHKLDMFLLVNVCFVLLAMVSVASFSQVSRMGMIKVHKGRVARHSNVIRSTRHLKTPVQKHLTYLTMTTNGDNNYFFPWDNEEGLEGQLDDDTDGDEVGVYRKKRVKLSRSFLERIANHDLIHATEIEKLFAPTKLDQDYIIGSTLSRGFVGFILSLEGALVDVTKLYEECYRTFIKEAMHGQKKEQLPSKATIHDIIGLTFQDASVEMQIGIPKESLVDAELEFYSLMNRILDDWFDHNPDAIKAQKGSFALIEHLLKDHNELAVQSNLPREIAQRLLGHTGLADLLADKGISIEQFVPYPFPYQINDDQDFNDDHKERSLLDHAKRPMSTEYDNYDDMLQNFYAPMHGDRFQINQYLRCCAKLQSIPSMSVLIDSNRKNIVTAKRIGIPCIAVKGMSMAIHRSNIRF